MAASKRKVVVTFDTYLSILAVVSSFCAIGITFYQAYLQRTQQYASVMPVLDVYLKDVENDNKAWHILFIVVNDSEVLLKCRLDHTLLSIFFINSLAVRE